MPLIDNATVHCKAVVPPGRSLVGVYPLALFRFDRLLLPNSPGLSICRGGSLIPCDGQVHLNASHERTLTVGNFFAFDVKNDTGEPRAFELTLSGPTVDGPREHEGFVVLGTFASEVEHSPLPPDDDDGGDYDDYRLPDEEAL